LGIWDWDKRKYPLNKYGVVIHYLTVVKKHNGIYADAVVEKVRN